VSSEGPRRHTGRMTRWLRLFAESGLFHKVGLPRSRSVVEQHAIGQPPDGRGASGDVDGDPAICHGPQNSSGSRPSEYSAASSRAVEIRCAFATKP
jgi:hypothetical protein